MKDGNIYNIHKAKGKKKQKPYLILTIKETGQEVVRETNLSKYSIHACTSKFVLINIV